MKERVPGPQDYDQIETCDREKCRCTNETIDNYSWKILLFIENVTNCLPEQVFEVLVLLKILKITWKLYRHRGKYSKTLTNNLSKT